MRVTIGKRNFTEQLLQPQVRFEVEKYSNHAIGGPYMATIKATGPGTELWELVETIRCPIVIYSDLGDAVWWGIVSQIYGTLPDLSGRQQGDMVRHNVSIDEMFNRILVGYVKIDVDTGVRKADITAWTDDLESQAEYGIKELYWTNGSASQGHAEAARDMRLTQDKDPKSLTVAGGRGAAPSVTLVCRGLWTTLGWLYYANASTASMDTAVQIFDIITAKGQFFYSVHMDIAASGIGISEKRDGRATALFFVEQLLETGTANFRRMLAEVDPQRRVRVYEEPQLTAYPYLMTADGKLRGPVDEPIRSELCPAAIWVRMKDVIPQTVDTTRHANPSPFFVEEMEYLVAQDRLVPRARGDLDPWQYPRIKDG